MKLDNVFDNSDSKTIDRVTSEYPVLSEKEKERLFAMSERKFNKNSNTDNITEVSGVEKYRKPNISRILCTAAAAVLFVGGIGGGIFLLNRNCKPDIEISDKPRFLTVTNTIVETSKTAAEENEYYAAALDLTDRLEDISKIIIADKPLDFDENDSVTFNFFYPDTETDKTRTFYKVTDERFGCCDDIKNALADILSENYMSICQNYPDDLSSKDKLFRDYLDRYVGGDASEYSNGDTIDCSLSENNINLEFDNYIDYNGSLYYGGWKYTANGEYTSEPEITETGENHFKAERYATFRPLERFGNATIGVKVTFEFIKENNVWKIDNIVRGINVECSAAEIIQAYLNNSDDDTYYGYHTILFSDVSDYIEDTGCKAHVTLSDGESVIEVYADVSLKDRTAENITINDVSIEDQHS